MTSWWEIFATSDGELIVERHRQGWRFETKPNPGRPKVTIAGPGPVETERAAASPLDVLPFDFEGIRVV